MDKKSEGRSSSWLIILIISLSLMIWIGTLVTQLVVSYQRTDIPEFQKYNELYKDSFEQSRSITASQQNQTSQADSYDRSEDIWYKKAFRGINLMTNSIGLFTETIYKASDGTFFGMAIDGKIIFLTVTIIGFIFIIQLISIYLKWKV